MAPPPKPYGQTLYAIDDDDTSGIVGSVDPGGTVKAHQPQPCPAPVRYWDEATASWMVATSVWNGINTGTVQLGRKGQPHRRTEDRNTLLGVLPRGHRP